VPGGGRLPLSLTADLWHLEGGCRGGLSERATEEVPPPLPVILETGGSTVSSYPAEDLVLREATAFR